MLEQIHIAVLMGGPGSERRVSLASGKAVVNALKGLGLNVTGVDLTSKSINLPVNTGLAFNVIHGTFGEDGELKKSWKAWAFPTLALA